MAPRLLERSARVAFGVNTHILAEHSAVVTRVGMLSDRVTPKSDDERNRCKREERTIRRPCSKLRSALARPHAVMRIGDCYIGRSAVLTSMALKAQVKPLFASRSSISTHSPLAASLSIIAPAPSSRVDERTRSVESDDECLLKACTRSRRRRRIVAAADPPPAPLRVAR